MNSRGLNGFDGLAPYYDTLARVLFGKQIVLAQTCFLSVIPPYSRILILGGGTGWHLAELLKRCPGCEIWYVESSSKMLSMAMGKNRDARQVHWIHGTEMDIPSAGFDVVIAYFFFDLFSPPTLQRVIRKIANASKPSVIWMVADFTNEGKWWQSLLLRAMYLFFAQLCRIEARSMPCWSALLEQSGRTRVDGRSFYAGFIESSVYRALV